MTSEEWNEIPQVKPYTEKEQRIVDELCEKINKDEYLERWRKMGAVTLKVTPLYKIDKK